MTLFQSLSIKRKQMLVIMLTSTMALLLACAGFFTYQITAFRRELAGNVKMLADVIGNNSAGALDFNDPKAAQEILSALQVNRGIVVACTYAENGQPFAVYQRSDTKMSFVPPPVEPSGHRFVDRNLILFHRIEQKGNVVGTVYLRADMSELADLLKKYTGVAGIVLCASLFAALLLSARLQRWLSEPVLHLAQIAKTVALEKNYGVRAVKQSEDELGVLTDGFNEMLTQIQQRDAALQAANEGLEKRVVERTGALKQANDQLQHEVGEHARAEEAARKARAFSDWVVNSLPGIFYLLDETGQFVRWNKNFELVTGYSADEMARRNALDYFVGEDQRLIQDRIQQVFTAGETDVEALLVAKDGTKIPYYFTGVRIHIDDKPCLIGTGLDITERKRAETNLEQVHRQLLDASRQAGMAEVATNVLHNVGNVLNSVNVSTALVVERMRQSKAQNLTKLAALLREHQPDLAAFLTHDPKGQRVPEYLTNLAEYLVDEQALVLKELQSLTTNIEHIKEIVAMQQNYSKVGGVVETLPITDLVEDALRLNAGALARHGVQIVRDFAPVPPISVEKHKVLQILVNLIRNAKYALDEGGGADRRLSIHVSKNGGGTIHVAVCDNGVGIPAENLTRIFEHGFTTRKDGHGFGLHSGALAAKELGGSLHVQSDGAGRGATFTLELPMGTTKGDL